MSVEKTNREVILVSRPGVNGSPKESNFETRACPYPEEPLQDGQILIKTLYLSVDPAQRCQMNESTGVDYIKPNELGQRINGLSGIGKIVACGPNCQLAPGKLVVNYDALFWPWTEYFVASESGYQEVGPDVLKLPQALHIPLAFLGVVGLTSYLGLKEKGKVKAGDVVVVSGAAGACGTLAGQFAKIEGAKVVVGICGSDEKCSYIVNELGFTHAVNYKEEGFEEKLTEACGSGVDVYFDNVGGEISRKIIVDLMNTGGRVVLCGQIADYNKDLPYPPPIPDDMKKAIEEKSIERERFLVLAYKEKFATALQEMKALYSEGKIRIAVTVSDGLEKAGWAFVSMMEGGNIGKQLVKVADFQY